MPLQPSGYDDFAEVARLREITLVPRAGDRNRHVPARIRTHETVVRADVEIPQPRRGLGLADRPPVALSAVSPRALPRDSLPTRARSRPPAPSQARHR